MISTKLLSSAPATLLISLVIRYDRMVLSSVPTKSKLFDSMVLSEVMFWSRLRIFVILNENELSTILTKIILFSEEAKIKMSSVSQRNFIYFSPSNSISWSNISILS